MKRVLKFGGSSVGTPDRIRGLRDILVANHNQQIEQIVVVSAFQGTTDTLLELAHHSTTGDSRTYTLLSQLRERHITAVKELLPLSNHPSALKEVMSLLDELDETLRGIQLIREASQRTLDLVMSFGERLSATIVAHVVAGAVPGTIPLDARSVIVTDNSFGNGRVDFPQTRAKLLKHFANTHALQIVTGFIGATPDGTTTTLGRGGSDYTAAILGACLKVDEIEIWTDVDGVLTADPRKVKKAFPLPELTYQEAMELSHFGAKVIYPPTIQPAFAEQIPIRVKNSFNPTAAGTLISFTRSRSAFPISGISSINPIALIRVEGSGMIGVAGIASRLFGALARRKINIILITQASSEHSICLGVSPAAAKEAAKCISDEFALEIKDNQIDQIKLEQQLAIVAVVGENMQRTPGVAGKVFQALGKNGINVRAIAQGSSELNISVVIDAADEKKALNVLHDAFFLSDLKTVNLFVLGPGNVGRALLQQIADHHKLVCRERKIDLRLVGVANSKKLLFEENGVALASWQRDLEASPTGFELAAFVERLTSLNLPNSIFVDCTAEEDIADYYEQILRRSISVVTPNKRANSGPLSRYQQLHDLAQKANVKFFYETNVGAGLPIINTLSDLKNSGDSVIRIDGVLSGTLSYLFNLFDGSKPFSEIVREARELGITEPDPREDLSGRDVARKLLILAREIGLALEESQISVESLVPRGCENASTPDEFLSRLQEFDTVFDQKLKDATGSGCVLRYLAQLTPGDIAPATVKLVAVSSTDPFASLSGSDNMVVFTTQRYYTNPLVVRGPGAGRDVTAAGVFADIVRAASYLT